MKTKHPVIYKSQLPILVDQQDLDLPMTESADLFTSSEQESQPADHLDIRTLLTCRIEVGIRQVQCVSSQ